MLLTKQSASRGLSGGIRRPVALIMLSMWLLLEVPLHAYLDPGSGSMLLQLLLGGFVGVGMIVRLYWTRLTALLQRKDSQRDIR